MKKTWLIIMIFVISLVSLWCCDKYKNENLLYDNNIPYTTSFDTFYV